MHPLYEKAASLTDEVVKAAVRVRDHFGIGALESIYVRCLEQELKLAGHETFLVDDCLLVEAKACEKENMEVWRMQLLTYMKLMDKPLGLVINFGNESFPRRGLKRVILKGADDVEAPF